jgi:hypothetical protein
MCYGCKEIRIDAKNRVKVSACAHFDSKGGVRILRLPTLRRAAN